ncbi:MAG: hypothetical protein KDA44_10440 [Planctomycetales bacterium]|nr:hypothetical protein [Planctomycetales bacterium]
MFKSVLIATTTLLVFVSEARAALQAYDGFNYSAGTLSGQGSAADPGFSTAWTQGTAGGEVVSSGLTFANLQTSGGALNIENTGGTTTTNFRGLSQTFDDASDTTTGEAWFSYLIQPGAYTGNPFVGLSFYTEALAGTTVSDGDFYFAVRNVSPSRYTYGDLDATNFKATGVAPEAGVTALLVGRVVFGAGPNTSATNEDQIYLYVNPTLGGPAPSADADTALTADFQTIRFASQNGAPFLVDEFRFGESFADVTPIIPPDPNVDGTPGISLSDFNVIRTNFLTGTTHAQGDVNYDGLVDHADFFLWRTAYLASGGSLEGVNLSLTPEPSSGLAAIILTCAGGFCLRQVRRSR